MQRTKEKWTKSKQDLRIQVISRMKCHLTSSKPLTEDRDIGPRRRTRMLVESLYSVGLVAKIIKGEIFPIIRVVYHRSTVLKTHRQWEMLGRVFLGSMPC